MASPPPPPRPPAAPPPPPPRPAAPVPSKRTSRRKFLTLIAVIGGLLSLAPYVPFGTFLSASASGRSVVTKPQTIVLDTGLLANNGNAGGKKVNVNDLSTFPPNAHWVMTYPSSGDPNLDGQNPDTFVKWDLIRLPSELGGSDKSASAFVAFSKVCVHLWCSPNYGGQSPADWVSPSHATNRNDPQHQDYECPCHGSLYSVGPTSLNQNAPVGVAYKGPAAIQPAPTNAIPMLTLTADASGNLQVIPPVWDIDHNGVIGYGRNASSNALFTAGYQPK